MLVVRASDACRGERSTASMAALSDELEACTMFDREVGRFAGPVATTRPSGHFQFERPNPSTPVQDRQWKAEMVTLTCLADLHPLTLGAFVWLVCKSSKTYSY
ncbi:MAG: hypothetical protein EOO38_22485 [Cytophagaceae bacterium]|nr:MAG: hypothetical protein EOO38_22485 [Cytophagaceae bacterium]